MASPRDPDEPPSSEELRKQKREIKRTQRGIDRDVGGIEREEKKLVRSPLRPRC